MADLPGDFLWGSGTSAHQVEGGTTNNDWWAWEHRVGTTVAEPSGDAIDQWHRFDSDLALLASLGHKAHRFSLEWSRIEPAPGEVSQVALDHYAAVLDSIAGHGMTAFATMLHFTVPRWFAERGGWLASDALDVFGRFVETVGARLGDRIPYACTINEPQIVALNAHAFGAFPPGHRDWAEAEQVNHVLAAAHRTAVAALRAGRGNPLIGTCLSLQDIEPVDAASAEDVALADRLDALMWRTHLDDLRAPGDVGDWVGLQYYTRMRASAANGTLTAAAAPGVETTLMGWEVHPAGLGRVLRRLSEVGLPIVITENGIATFDDDQRVRFLAAHLRELAAAVADGVDVRGYLHWSAFDNFEWTHGYRPTFGLVGIDRADGLRRVVRRSAELYAEVCRTGSLAVFDGV